MLYPRHGWTGSVTDILRIPGFCDDLDSFIGPFRYLDHGQSCTETTVSASSETHVPRDTYIATSSETTSARTLCVVHDQNL